VTVRFFLRDDAGPPAGNTELPAGLRLTIWRPREQPAPPFDPLRLAVWLQDRCGLFADGRYSELSLWSGERRVHRLVVTPRWYRFPFMAPGDLQLGALWTDPAWRRQGLARLAMAEAHRLFPGLSQRLWYVTDEANVASLALARSAGNRPVGEGRRTNPVGIAFIGRFELDSAAVSSR
jgi:RimJ/RimL family protein N-acetyltransferase